MEPHLLCYGAVFRKITKKKKKKKRLMSYCQKKKNGKKLRGREFRLITVTEGMMPIGM